LRRFRARPGSRYLLVSSEGGGLASFLQIGRAMEKSNPSKHVAVLIGSLRKGSVSRKVARALIERAPKGVLCDVIEIGDLALYNEDLEQPATPASWTAFRAQVQKADALLFVTPEYNRSIPGCLKNALDVGSRPAKASVFDGKPAAVVSVTPYKLGAFGANHALRQTFVFLNMPVMQQPEAYIGMAAELFDTADELKDGEAAKLFEKFMHAFADWIETVNGDGEHEFDGFMKRRQEIASAYVHGDGAPLAASVTKESPATFYCPGGEIEQGAEQVAERYARDAKSFRGQASTELEVLQSGASGKLAFWTGLQHAEVETEKTGRTKMTLRVTEVFRHEDGAFKLVHRHADAAKK
jgi:NAD(P)H-dependent FMN reductase/ketosteroid isomerase-like protein